VQQIKCFIYDEQGKLEETITGDLLDLMKGVTSGSMCWSVVPYADMSVIHMGRGEIMPQEVIDIVDKMKDNPNVIMAQRPGSKAGVTTH